MKIIDINWNKDINIDLNDKDNRDGFIAFHSI